uniref:Uncharacterized protein n=1 Tax=Arundo donax TaxID=35708 RepID=A0A0A9AV57_ARUDO
MHVHDGQGESFLSPEMHVRLCKNRMGNEMWGFLWCFSKEYCNNARDYLLVVSFLGNARDCNNDVPKEVKRKRLILTFRCCIFLSWKRYV